ncbi:MAG: Alpha/beta hydrolase fold protein [Proteobacteria bacterium]|nr:Alpha/beta hydrolase fold protein [Pseudomonadota bacterium]
MEKYISTSDGLSLWSESFGVSSGRPLLLIMGAMNQGIFWPDAFCERLAALGHFVVRYDHRDTGLSSCVDFQSLPYSLKELSDDALAVMRGHGMSRAIVVGLSMGGYAAQLLAVEHPEAVESLVLISTTADHRPYVAATMGRSMSGLDLPAPGQALLDYIQATLAEPPQSPAEIETNLLNGWALTYGGSAPFPREQIADALRLAAKRSSNPLAAFNHAQAVAASPDRLEIVKSIRVPALVIHGREDICLPLRHGEYLAHHIPGARLRVLDMGHAFMWAMDDAVLAEIADFLDEQDAA